jgi:ABC-2 type transport system ATP-binding protein
VEGHAVEVTDLVMRYGDTIAVDGLSLTVQSGGVTAVLGPNGAGKTTTIETCEGYRRPQGGRVRVLGMDPLTQHRALSSRVGVMLQQGGAWPSARPVEMIRYVASLHARPLPVGALVERLGLGGCGRTPYRRLSGGQQQRLGIAMAVVGRPELVFLDEPTAGLDPQARRATWDLVEELSREGVTVVLTTHYIEEAERLADQVHVLDHGTVLASGTPEQLTARAAGETISFTAPEIDVAALTAALPDGCTVSAEPGGRYVVSGAVSPHTLAAVATWCASRGIMPRGLDVGRTTLEDVFLELTGRELWA